MAQDSVSSRLGKLARPGLRWLPVLAWLVVLTFAAWASADLFWRFTRPAPVAALPASETDPVKAARLLASRNPFGTTASLPVVASQEGRGPDYILVGLATGFGDDPGFALLQSGTDAPIPVLVGESPTPGVVLRRILPDRVELEVSGRIHELPLRKSLSSTAMDTEQPQQSAARVRTHPRFGRPGRFGSNASE